MPHRTFDPLWRAGATLVVAGLVAATPTGCTEHADDPQGSSERADADGALTIASAAGTFRLDKQAMREEAERRIEGSGQDPEADDFAIALAMMDGFDVVLELLTDGGAVFTTTTPDGVADISEGTWEIEGGVITVSPSPESAEPPATGVLEGDILTLNIPDQPDAIGMLFRRATAATRPRP